MQLALGPVAAGDSHPEGRRKVLNLKIRRGGKDVRRSGKALRFAVPHALGRGKRAPMLLEEDTWVRMPARSPDRGRFALVLPFFQTLTCAAYNCGTVSFSKQNARLEICVWTTNFRASFANRRNRLLPN
jgi:hypothetical protein